LQGKTGFEDRMTENRILKSGDQQSKTGIDPAFSEL